MSLTETMLQSFEPATGALLWEGAMTPPEALDDILTRARNAQRGWEAAGLDARIAVARRFADLAMARQAEFATLIARETGKPFWETQTEVASVAAKIAISITAQAARAGDSAGEMAGAAQHLRHRPHGVLAVLGPYNFPAHLPNGHIVPALLAGNAVVLKPSEKTPAVAEFLAQIWADAGLPEAVLHVVQGEGALGKALAGHGDIDGLLFTGSSATGAHLARQFGETPWKMLALEMGGNNPLLAWDVAPDDLDDAAATIVQSAYLSSGQRCTCARRWIVEDGRADALIERVVALIDRIRVDEPFADPAPFMGPVIDGGAADALEQGAAQLIHLGGRAIRPIRRLQGDLPFLSPALIDMSDAAEAPDTEYFGPLLQLYRVADWDMALARANATRFGLSASLIGGDRARFDDFWSRSRAGIVNWNRPTNGASSAAPFGGVGLSGNHRPSALYAADYVAFPVAGLEAEHPTATIGTGLSDG